MAQAMSWLPPFFACGECGGEIGRWPVVNPTAGQRGIMADLEIDVLYDWRHHVVPEGVGPHRAVLGTPVPLAEVVLAPVEPEEAVDEEEPDPVPAPEVPAMPVSVDELPDSAARIVRLAVEYGWETHAVYMKGPRMSARWKVLGIVESVVVILRRDGVRLAGAWQRAEDAERYAFDFALLHGHYTRVIGSPELRAEITRPRIYCETCGEVPAMHVLTPSGLLCHSDFQILTPGGTA